MPSGTRWERQPSFRVTNLSFPFIETVQTFWLDSSFEKQGSGKINRAVILFFQNPLRESFDAGVSIRSVSNLVRALKGDHVYDTRFLSV